MDRNQIKRSIFLTSLVLTLIIFLSGIMLSYILDFYRMDEIERVIETHEADRTAYMLEQQFMHSVGGDNCNVMGKRFYDLKMDIHKVGIALNSYKGRSMVTKVDFDYLKRHYFLLELEFFTLIKRLNLECNMDYVSILFFYEKDDPDSITQGYVLEDISKSFTTNVVVLSLDKDYLDEQLVSTLVNRYNVTVAPTIVINNLKVEGLQYGGVVNATVKEIIRNSSTDKFARHQDIDYELASVGVDKAAYAGSLLPLLEQARNTSNEYTSNEYLAAELMYLHGRLTDNVTEMCDSLQHYDNAVDETDDEELKAFIYETITAIGCGRNRVAFLDLASQSWRKAGNLNRADIDAALVKGMPLPIRFDISGIEPSLIVNQLDATSLVLGASHVELSSKDLIVSQVDRVTRDWLGVQFGSPLSDVLLRTFSERRTYSQDELREDIGWHEGARIDELRKIGIRNELATGTMVINKNGTWYAPNEEGIFMFEVPKDKVLYPTTRFLRQDIAIVEDTHGMNMIVEQAIRKNASVVIGCCDNPAKIKAALYLSDKGMKVICLTDKFGYLALGKDSDILASPPIKIDAAAGTAVVGAQPIKIRLDEKIIVTNSTDTPYALWYYQTPASYFGQLSASAWIALNLTYITLNDFGQMNKIVKAAVIDDAHVIATRVFSLDDYKMLRTWLFMDPSNRAILFHSASYPYGYMMLKEFPNQVTFGDVNPRFE